MRSILTGFLTLMLCCLVVAGCRPRTSAVKVLSQPPQDQPAKVVQVGNGGDKKGPDKKGTDKKGGTPGKENAKPKSNPQPGTWTAEVKGFGAFDKAANNDDAEAAEKQAQAAALKHATDKAQQMVRDYLRSQNPPILWEPSSEYVAKNFLGKQEPQRCEGDDNTVEKEQPPISVRMHCWSWALSITPQQLEAMRVEDSRYRIQAAVQARSAVAETRMLELSRLVVWAVLALIGVMGFIRLEDWSRGIKRRWLRVALVSLLGVGGVGWWLLS
jgi:hypothetical protein